MMSKLKVFVVIVVIMLMVGCSKAPDSQQIKTDLIGQTMESRLGVWQFGSLDEFQEFTINNKNLQGDIIEYDVSMLLKDSSSGKMYRTESVIVYKKIDGSWRIALVSNKSVEQAR